MIASVNGRVAAVSPDGAVVEVGGIGLAVQCTPGTIARLQVGEQARLATSLVVREDSLTLYGFADDDERTVFELLQTASGVGPRLAQADDRASKALVPVEALVRQSVEDVEAGDPRRHGGRPEQREHDPDNGQRQDGARGAAPASPVREQRAREEISHRP